MDSVNSRLVLLDDQSSRKKRKIGLIVSLIIIFGTIIACIISALTILKHEAESESLLSVAAPARAIAAVCSLTPYPTPCSRSLQSLHVLNRKITPSQMFSTSAQSAQSQLTIILGSRAKVVSSPSLQECKSLASDSLRLINQSINAIGIIPDDEMFKDFKRVGDMKEWMKSAEGNLNQCLKGLGIRVLGDGHQERLVFGELHVGRMKMEMLLARQYVANSYVMLEKNGVILDMFYNPIPLHSVLANIMLSTGGFGFSMVFFPSQYLVLVFLFCLLLRL